LVSCSGHIITEITPSRHWKGVCLSVPDLVWTLYWTKKYWFGSEWNTSHPAFNWNMNCRRSTQLDNTYSFFSPAAIPQNGLLYTPHTVYG
jgi:hypothetical protein